MKKILLMLTLLVGLTNAQGQTITYDDFKSLIPSLQSENWKSAFEMSKKLLIGAEKDSSEFKAIVLYVNIYSAAGMVTQNQMTYKELKLHIGKFEGQKIMMPAHPIGKNENNTLNQTILSTKNGENTAFTTSTNAEGTSIFCFEKFHFKNMVDISDFGDSMIQCGGVVEKIETNPNESTIWILRLTIKDAFARKAS